MSDRTLQVGVKVLLQDATGKYLLLHRSAEVYPEVKQPLDTPGGRIDIGTSLFDNLQREVYEETGLGVQGEPRIIDAQDILRIPERHVVRLTFVAKTEGQPKLSQDHTSYEWLTLDELLANDKVDEYLKKTVSTAKANGLLNIVV